MRLRRLTRGISTHKPTVVDLALLSSSYHWMATSLPRSNSTVGSGLLYCCFTSTEARWPIRDGDIREGDDRVKARSRKPPEKDRRDRGPPPEQWKC